jgi:trehalose-6-phosphate synthase
MRVTPVSPRSRQLIVVSNREPYHHAADADGTLRVFRCSSGVVNAVEPLLMRNGGVWVAAGDGDGDRVTALNADGLEVPPAAPRYRLRRVWMTPEEQQGYYYGFANSALWPLCHRTSVKPTFYAQDFGTYELVNRRFAEAVAEESRENAPGLPFRARAGDDSAAAAARARCHLLAHPLAAPAGVPPLPVEPGDSRRAPRQHGDRVPDAARS